MAKRFSRKDPKVGEKVYYTELFEGATQVIVVDRFMYEGRKFIVAIYADKVLEFIVAEAKWFSSPTEMEKISD